MPEIQPLGKNEASAACSLLLRGVSAETRIDVTHEEAFQWKRFLSTQNTVGVSILGEGICSVYAVRMENDPVSAFCCVCGTTRVFAPGKSHSVPPFKEMETAIFEKSFPGLSTATVSWTRM